MILHTQRLMLRPWTEADAETLFKYAADPEVGPAAGWAAHTSVEDSREIIRTVLSAEGTFAVCLDDRGGEPVGSIGWFVRDGLPDGVEIGYWIGKPFWGQGYIPEAVECVLEYLFTETDCPRVWCSHFLGNEKSKRVIEKCGFRPEFLQEREWPAIGKKLTEQFYSIRKAEYLSKHSR